MCALKCCFFPSPSTTIQYSELNQHSWYFHLVITRILFLYSHCYVFHHHKKQAYCAYYIIFCVMCGWKKERGTRQANSKTRNRERECEETCVMMTAAIIRNLFDQYSNNQNKNLKCFINFYRKIFFSRLEIRLWNFFEE